MLRVAGWTVGLFGAGATICRIFMSPWVEPVVLLALGMAFLFVSNRTGRARSRRPVVAKLPARAVASKPAPAAAAVPAAVPVEQSA